MPFKLVQNIHKTCLLNTKIRLQNLRPDDGCIEAGKYNLALCSTYQIIDFRRVLPNYGMWVAMVCIKTLCEIAPCAYINTPMYEKCPLLCA